MTTLYDADGIWPVSELIAILNGTGGNITPQMFYISDHGSTTVGMVKLNTSTLSNLNNTRPFFFYDDSCDVGHFDSADCFGEVVTTMEHGAFACILNSRSGWGSSTGDNLDSPTINGVTGPHLRIAEKCFCQYFALASELFLCGRRFWRPTARGRGLIGGSGVGWKILAFFWVGG